MAGKPQLPICVCGQISKRYRALGLQGDRVQAVALGARLVEDILAALPQQAVSVPGAKAALHMKHSAHRLLAEHAISAIQTGRILVALGFAAAPPTSNSL